MADVQHPLDRGRPSTPPRRLLNAPVLSPSRMPQSFSSYHKTGHLNLDTFSPVDQNGSFCFDRVIKTGKVFRRIKKKGAWKASWKPAYLVLRPNLLSIYKHPDETNLRASIALSDITVVARVRKSHLDNVFGIFSPSKNYHFQAANEKETADWVNQIRLEARADELDLEGLDAPAPQFTKDHQPPPATYDTTDVSADESPDPPGSPEAPAWPVQGKERATKPPASRPRGTSGYSTNEAFTTSHSSFSDFAPGSQPKSLTTSSTQRPNPLSPIASSQQLRPSQPPRNASQLSVQQQHDSADRVIHQGYLSILRQSRTFPNMHTWKTLWTVLRPKNLSFYKSEAEYSVVKMIPMSNVIDAVEIDPPGKSKSRGKSGKGRWCFEIIAVEKGLRCSIPTGDDARHLDGGDKGEDEEEKALEGWLGAFKSVIEKRREREKEWERDVEKVEEI